jgi:hypothetical protein
MVLLMVAGFQDGITIPYNTIFSITNLNHNPALDLPLCL